MTEQHDRMARTSSVRVEERVTEASQAWRSLQAQRLNQDNTPNPNDVTAKKGTVGTSVQKRAIPAMTNSICSSVNCHQRRSASPIGDRPEAGTIIR